MKVSAKVLKKWTEDGKLLSTVQFDRKCPPEGQIVKVSWGIERSLQQNRLYWMYLNYLINEAGLDEQGHFSAEALHLDLKKHFLSEKVFSRGQFKAIEEGTTTTLTKSEFTEYLQKVDQFVVAFFEVNTQPFWNKLENQL